MRSLAGSCGGAWDVPRGGLRFCGGFCGPGWFVCALLAGRGGRVAAGVGGSLSDRGASLTGPRSLAADLSVKSQQFVCVQFDVS